MINGYFLACHVCSANVTATPKLSLNLALNPMSPVWSTELGVSLESNCESCTFRKPYIALTLARVNVTLTLNSFLTLAIIGLQLGLGGGDLRMLPHRSLNGDHMHPHDKVL